MVWGWFLRNHVLANLTFVLVLVLGALAYQQMPRAKDPEINFNWISIITFLPGASAHDVEKRLTDPIEDAIRRSVQDIDFVFSTSRANISNIVVRFNDIDERTFDKRLTDLRREVQNTYTDELPDEAEAPVVYEITTSNALPAATVIVTGAGDDENLRRHARNIKKDLERIEGVDRITDIGLAEPELHVAFDPAALVGLGVGPADLADSVRGYFRDVSAGDLDTRDGQWVVRVAGTDADPSLLAAVPIAAAQGVVTLGSVARVYRATEELDEIVRYGGRPALMLAVTKRGGTNVIDLVDRVQRYVAERNLRTPQTGVTLAVVDDQTAVTRSAVELMETNAALGLMLVLLTTWLFLGSRIAVLTTLGIPFALAGTFIVLHASGISLNNTVLLGVVIALGMLVDDAVVIVESIYLRLVHGMRAFDATIDAMREVWAPVMSSVLTTIAAFLPLMLLPGILGDFMKIVPIVVSVALAVSVIEAYWMLPAHIIILDPDFTRRSRSQIRRDAITLWLKSHYSHALCKVLRHPGRAFAALAVLFGFTIGAFATGWIRVDYFALDSQRLFYVNIEMPASASLQETSTVLDEIERRARAAMPPEDLHATVAYAGQQFTRTEPLFGDTVGQVMVSLRPPQPDGLSVEKIADRVKAAVEDVPGPVNVAMFIVRDGPPVQKPISVKIRGDEYDAILRAADALVGYLKSQPSVSDVTLDYRPGTPELVATIDGEAVQRTGVPPMTVSRTLGLFVDGEIVTEFQYQGEEVSVRVLPQPGAITGAEDLLRQTISLPGGGSIAIGELVEVTTGPGQQNIRHYNFRRAITLEAEIDKTATDTVRANAALQAHWASIMAQHPTVDLEFSGELDDVKESLDGIYLLFMLGVGLIYLILGAQFRSYVQPFLILTSVPLAFAGVVCGLLASGNPLSLYTMYGVVALTGVAVNSAIVLISAANDRVAAGMSLIHAIVYAARRRLIPILITSLTTIAGLMSLAFGFAGKSLVWGPVATAIVWGLGFSTVLTLLVVPLLYLMLANLQMRGGRWLATLAARAHDRLRADKGTPT